MLSTPAGSPASAKISPQSRPPEIGDHSDGFSTTVLPSASGAAIERAERISADVPRRDRADDADRPAQAHRERARVGRDHLAERRVGERRRLAQEPGHEVHLEHPEPERAARLAREEGDDLVLAALEHVGRLEEDALPRGRRASAPRPGTRRRGDLDRAARVLARSGRDLDDDLAR